MRVSMRSFLQQSSPPLHQRQLMQTGPDWALNEESVPGCARLEPRVEIRIRAHRLRMNDDIDGAARLTEDGGRSELHRHDHDASVGPEEEELLAVVSPARTAAAGLRDANRRRRGLGRRKIDL